MELRRTQRYALRLPLSIGPAGAPGAPKPAHTRNISCTGVLFEAAEEPEVGGRIEYVITLNPEGTAKVRLRCTGKVVRCETEPEGPGSRYAVAATLDRYEFIRSK